MPFVPPFDVLVSKSLVVVLSSGTFVKETSKVDNSVEVGCVAFPERHSYYIRRF